MSFDDERWQGPLLSAEQLADRQRRLIADADANALKQSESDSLQIRETINRVLQRFGPSALEWSAEDEQHWQAQQDAMRNVETASGRIRQAAKNGFPEFHLTQWKSGNPRWVPACSLLVNAFADGKKLIVLTGGVGTGKTMAATMCAVIPGARMISAFDIMSLSIYDNSAKHLLTCPLLVIDDLGVEFLDEKGTFNLKLEWILNGRYALSLPMVVTMNLTQAELKARYSDRIVDRIREVGRFISLSGESMRRA